MQRHASSCHLIPLLLCSAALLPGCRDHSDVPAEDDNLRAITYHGEIRALVEQHCVGCHQDGGIGSLPLTTWEEIEPMRSWIVEVVEDGSMPPWGQDPDCRPTPGSLALSDEVKATFSQWAEGGFAVGDPERYVAPPAPEPPAPVREPDLRLAAPMPYQIDAQLPDDYRCLVLDHVFEQDTFLSRVDVFPDRLDLVHHVIVFVAPPEQAELLQAMDDADAGPGFSCFGDSGIEGTQQIGGWVPGAESGGLPEGFAMRIAAGSRLITQMHYSTVGITEEQLATPDQTQLALWSLPPDEAPEYLVHSMPVAQLDLSIAAGDPASSHMVTTRIPVDGLLMTTSPHMHLLGKSVETRLLRPDGRSECLTKVDDWDFNWQRDYAFSEFLPISIDDRIEMTCVYDNSVGNQPYVGGVPIEPRDVTWGDGTYDEMCLDFLTVAVPFEDDGSSGTCAGFQTCNARCDADDPYCTMSCMSAAGEACLYCGVEAMLGPCGQARCLPEIIELGECLDVCTDSDFFGCLVDRCDAPMRAYHDCFAPSFSDDTCREDLDACPGLLSPA